MNTRTIVAGSAVIVGAALVVVAAVKSAPKKVEVQYVGGEECARAVPDRVEIFTDDNVLKPKKVKWVVDKSLGFEWTFEYSGNKKYDVNAAAREQGVNLLGGPFVIAAGEKRIKSGKSDVAGVWPYLIDVVDPSGDGGCTADPEVIVYD